MSTELPVLAGLARINLYSAGAVDLNSPVISDLVVNGLNMVPQIKVVTSRITGATAIKHHSIVTHHKVSWETVEALRRTEAFKAAATGRYVMEVVWSPDVLSDGRWKRRIYSGVTLGGDALSSRGALELNASMEWHAEAVAESAGDGVMAVLTTPLPA